MWEELYKFMKFLNSKIERYPKEEGFTIEMEQPLFDFCREIGFIPENGIFKFNGKFFVLG